MGWLFLLIPLGIVCAIFYSYWKMNRGNRPGMTPPSLEHWNSSLPAPNKPYDPPPTHSMPPPPNM